MVQLVTSFYPGAAFDYPETMHFELRCALAAPGFGAAARVVVAREPEQELVQRRAALGVERREELVLDVRDDSRSRTSSARPASG